MADKFVVLVEGSDDYHVMQHLLTVHGVDKQIRYRLEGHPTAKFVSEEEVVFKDKKGITNVRAYLSQQLRITGEMQAIGVIVDADLDISASWQSLRDILIKSGYLNVPKVPDPYGLILEQEEKPRVGLWVMPNNALPGMTEDFISLLVPPNNPLWERARLSVDQIPAAERLFGENAAIKAHVHTWLAWQKIPGLPMGQAINNRWLNPDAPEAVRLVEWLRRLFELKSD